MSTEVKCQLYPYFQFIFNLKQPCFSKNAQKSPRRCASKNSKTCKTVLIVETVDTGETVETVETVETEEIEETVETVQIEDLKSTCH